MKWPRFLLGFIIGVVAGCYADFVFQQRQLRRRLPRRPRRRRRPSYLRVVK